MWNLQLSEDGIEPHPSSAKLAEANLTHCAPEARCIEGRSYAPAFDIGAGGVALSLDVELFWVEGGIALDEDVFAHQFLELGEP